MTDKLIEFIVADVSLDADFPIVGSTDLLLTGLVDSLGVLDIVGWIEDNYSIEIDPADITLENFQTADLMAAYIDRRVSEPAS